jgi:hypothetical protein
MLPRLKLYHRPRREAAGEVFTDFLLGGGVYNLSYDKKMDFDSVGRDSYKKDIMNNEW